MVGRGFTAGRRMAKEEPKHTAARSLPFPQPFPAVPSPSTTVSPSLAASLAQPCPPSSAHCWKAFGGHGELPGEG